MAILGRGFPIKPHLARPIVGPGVAIVTRAYIVSAANEDLIMSRLSRTVKPLLPPAIVGAAARTPVWSRPFIVSAVRDDVVRNRLGRAPAPHLALPIRSPFVRLPLWTKAYIVSSVNSTRARYGRGIWPHARVAPPTAYVVNMPCADFEDPEMNGPLFSSPILSGADFESPEINAALFSNPVLN